MRQLLLGLALLLFAAAPAAATQISYIDDGKVWVSTLDGASKRPISTPPLIGAETGRRWTEQAQSDDGWIVGVARVPSQSGAAAPTKVWGPDGSGGADGALAYRAAFAGGSLAVPVGLDLTPGGAQLTYTYSHLAYAYPVSTLSEGTWVTNAATMGGEPFDIPNLVGASLVGSRLIGVNRHAGASDPNIVVQNGTGPFQTEFAPWFRAYGAWSVDVAANGSVVAVTFRVDSSGPFMLGLFAAAGVGRPLPGASCDVPTTGSVSDVTLSQDGRWVAWSDDRGVVVAAVPPLDQGSPCPVASAPVVISPTGSSPSLGPTTLAVAPTQPPTEPKPGSPSQPVSPAQPGGSPRSAGRSAVTVAASVKASALARGVRLKVTVTRAGPVAAVAKVGRTTIARGSAKAGRAGRVTVTLKATRAVARRLGRFKGKVARIVVRAPGATMTVRRTLR